MSRKLWALVGLLALSVGGFAAGKKEKPFIALLGRSEQSGFWQQVRKGAQDAATKLQIDFTFEGPPSDSDVQVQVEMFNNAISKKPVAIGIAALDTKSVMDQLAQAKREGIPVIGFDSGVPEAPPGSILATVSTDNYGISKLAAEKMFEQIKGRIAAATAEKPVTIVVFGQDATSTSVNDRGSGFRDSMIELIATLPGMSRDDVRLTGNPTLITGDSPTTGKKVFINFLVPASATITDASASAAAMLKRAKSDNTVGIFASNDLSASALLVASDEGAALPSYGMTVVGFDAGKDQKDAVRQRYFLGAITQNPYEIGYKALVACYQAYKKEPVQDVATATYFYTSVNMDDANIRDLLYDY